MSLSRGLLYFVSASGPYPMLPINQERCIGATDRASAARQVWLDCRRIEIQRCHLHATDGERASIMATSFSSRFDTTILSLLSGVRCHIPNYRAIVQSGSLDAGPGRCRFGD